MSWETVQLVVYAPVQTKEVLGALRDCEPVKGIRFTLAKRKSAVLLFDVSTCIGHMARDLALKRLREKGLSDLPQLDVSVR